MPAYLHCARLKRNYRQAVARILAVVLVDRSGNCLLEGFVRTLFEQIWVSSGSFAGDLDKRIGLLLRTGSGFVNISRLIVTHVENVCRVASVPQEVECRHGRIRSCDDIPNVGIHSHDR